MMRTVSEGQALGGHSKGEKPRVAQGLDREDAGKAKRTPMFLPVDKKIDKPQKKWMNLANSQSPHRTVPCTLTLREDPKRGASAD